MLNLSELQEQFLDALAGADQPDLLSLIDDREPGAAARLAVYRNNWRCNLRNALAAAYPVVKRLVGDEFFNWMSDQYIDAHPSTSGNLDEYGREFSAFIRAFPAAESLPYLGDVAQLELLIDRLMAAPNVPGGDGVAMPVAHLFASDFPVHRIWQVNQPEWQGDDSIQLDEGPAWLFVQRFARVLTDEVRFDLFIQTLSHEKFVSMQNAAAKTLRK